MVSFHTTLETLAQEVNDTKAESVVTLLQEHVKEIRSEDLPLLKEIRAKLGEETPASKQIAGIIQNLHPVKFSIGDRERVVFFNALKECTGLHEMVLDIGETEEAIPLPKSEEVLLDFLEGKEVNIDNRNVYAILHIADKWGAAKLADKCCERILKGFQPDEEFLGLKRNLRCAIISRMIWYQIRQTEQALPPKESLSTPALQDARDQVKEYLSNNDIWIPILKHWGSLSKKVIKMKEGLAREYFYMSDCWFGYAKDMALVNQDIRLCINEIIERNKKSETTAADIEKLKELLHDKGRAIFRDKLAELIKEPKVCFTSYKKWKQSAEGLENWMKSHDERLKELTDLDISSLSQFGLPKEIQRLTNLKSLTLKNAALWNLPKGLNKLSKLQTLDLRNNRLREIPIELRELNQLEVLRLDSNSINELPEWIKELTNLKILSITGNPLGPLPDWIKELQERGCKIYW